MKTKYKMIQITGVPNKPGLWYSYKDDAVAVLNECHRSSEQGKHTWGTNTLDQYKQGTLKFHWNDDDGGYGVWYGVVLDDDWEMNEFGVVLP